MRIGEAKESAGEASEAGCSGPICLIDRAIDVSSFFGRRREVNDAREESEYPYHDAYRVKSPNGLIDSEQTH